MKGERSRSVIRSVRVGFSAGFGTAVGRTGIDSIGLGSTGRRHCLLEYSSGARVCPRLVSSRPVARTRRFLVILESMRRSRTRRRASRLRRGACYGRIAPLTNEMMGAMPTTVSAGTPHSRGRSPAIGTAGSARESLAHRRRTSLQSTVGTGTDSRTVSTICDFETLLTVASGVRTSRWAITGWATRLMSSGVTYSRPTMVA